MSCESEIRRAAASFCDAFLTATGRTMFVFSDFNALSGRRGIRLCYAYTAYWQYFSFMNQIFFLYLNAYLLRIQSSL